MRRGLWIVLTTVGCLVGVWAAEPASDDDPWAGKTKSDVVTLLGDPTKTKDVADGGQVLTYKLVRLAEGAVAPAGMTVLNVPGLGVVGQMPKSGATVEGDTTITPTEVDKKGRPAGGGVTTEETVSVSWDTDTKEVERSWEDRPAIRGKVTLKFHVTESGEIESWSVAPKKAASER
jgi:hypothetical protein